MVIKEESTLRPPINSASMFGSKKWLDRLNSFIEENLDDPSLDNERLAVALDISERHLFRKVRALTNLPPQRYLSQYRLNRAMKYLTEGKYKTVKETCYAVGFRNTSYFIRQFERAYGKRPLRVLQESGWR